MSGRASEVGILAQSSEGCQPYVYAYSTEALVLATIDLQARVPRVAACARLLAEWTAVSAF